MQNPTAREQMFFDRTCQAVAIHGPERASLEEIQIPEVKPGDVLIRVAYEGICATDLEIFDGTLGYYKNGMAKYPIVPGHELSGRVVAMGPNVNHLQEGDGVVVEYLQSCGTCAACSRSNWIDCIERAELGVIVRNGGYAEYLVAPGRFVHRLPASMDLRKACLCEPLAGVLKGLKRLSRTWPSQPESKRCAVVGVGPLGHLCARVLALQGHKVTAFDRNPLRRTYFDGSGIDVSDDLSCLGEFDVLVEATGDPDALETMLQQSAAGATILLLGLPYSHRQFTFESIVAYDKTVVGSVGSSSQEFEEAIQLLPELDVNAYLQCILPLERYRDGWEAFREGKHLKVLLAVDREL
jgi:2-desacetyl-2-hydroxyethyl bacteriochlorophyllide A dehydrogenase